MDRKNEKDVRNISQEYRMILIERELTLFSTGKFSSRKEARILARKQLDNERNTRNKN